MGDMEWDISKGAVVHEGTGIQGPYPDRLDFAGSGGEIRSASTLAGDGMEVDVVRMGVAFKVGEGDFDHIPNATTQDRPRRTASDFVTPVDTEPPHLGGHVVGRIEGAHALD